MARNFIKKALDTISGIPIRVLCVLLVLLQCALLDYYLVHYNSLIWCLWVIADVIVAGVFIVAFVVSYKHLNLPSGRETANGGDLPLGYVAWGVYSFFLCIKTAIIFGPDENIAPDLSDDEFFGASILKAIMSISAVVYLLLVLTHHDAAPGSDRQLFIRSISHAVAMDVLDTVQLLDLLFILKTGILLSIDMHRTILASACINLLLPTLQLVVLSRTKFGSGSYTKKVRLLHTVVYLTLINLPMLVIRIILWHVNRTNVSVFLIKNIIAIGRTLYTIYEYWMEIGKQEHGPETDEHEAVEMNTVPEAPQNANANA